MLNREFNTGLIKRMLPCRFTLTRSRKTVSKLFTIIRQNGLNFDRTNLTDFFDKMRRSFCLPGQ